jgi:PAS domain S-box-containing protein
LIQDITELKNNEEALRESEEKFRNLVENAPVGITISTKDGRTIYRNKKIAEMAGYNQEEVVDLPSLVEHRKLLGEEVRVNVARSEVFENQVGVGTLRRTRPEVDHHRLPAELASLDRPIHRSPGTMAVIVNAQPEHIWPWLVQIGYQRGGLYSYDWLDRLFGYLDRPSATRILPEFQHLAVGDRIPLGRGPSWPVAVIEPHRALVLDMRNMGGFDWVWQFGLYPVDEKRTRLVSRSRVRTQTAVARLATYAIEPAGFLMTRRMLLGLKHRAEGLRAASMGESRANRRPAA